MDEIESWIGRAESAEDLVTSWQVQAGCATLGIPMPGEGMPVAPLLHWLFFRPATPLEDVGPDGHPARGGFLPLVTLPRRMWAGGRLHFIRPLQIGRTISRQSAIGSVRRKEGRSGMLVLVRVDHEISDVDGLLLREEHDIIYREAPRPGDRSHPTRAPTTSGWARRIDPNVVMLFRYSALTYNGHRIHYDRSYCAEVEGYPGLVVHGPMIATLLLNTLIREHPAFEVERFSFRALHPVLDTASFDVCGSLQAGGLKAALFARDSGGALCMEAEAVSR